jgi:probable F420-dependent oxidoreductase
VKLGLSHANIGRFSEPDAAAELASAAEAAGFESLWTVEHVVLPTVYEPRYPETPNGQFPFDVTEPIADPFVWLAFVAARTRRIKLGTGVVVLPQRNALVAAKAAATLDRLAGGRLMLGVGAGWLREEFDALGADFARRGVRLNESIELMRRLWTGEPATFSGETSAFSNVISRPTPARARIPVHVGGYSTTAAIRAGRLGDGFFPGGYGQRERLRTLIARARAEATAAGRDPEALEITARWTKNPDELSDLDALKELEEMGVHRVLIPVSVFDPGDLSGALHRLADRVLNTFAS